MFGCVSTNSDSPYKFATKNLGLYHQQGLPYDILRAVNRAEQSSASSRAKPDDGAVSSVGVSFGL